MSYRRRTGPRPMRRAFAGHGPGRAARRTAPEAAEANQAHRESIPATLRRIEKLEADRGALGGASLDGKLDVDTRRAEDGGSSS